MKVNKWITATTAALTLAIAPAFAATQFELNAKLNWNPSFFATSSLFSFDEPSTSTGNYQGLWNFTIPANTTDYAVAIPAVFAYSGTIIVLAMADVSPVPQALAVGLAAGGPRFQLAPGGFILLRLAGTATPPTVFFDNLSSNNMATVSVSVVAK